MSGFKSFDDYYPNFDADMTHMLDASTTPAPQCFSGFNAFVGGGSFEVFYQDAKHGRTIPAGGNPTHLGWYWWSCWPGCLPDSDPSGPFSTAEGAYLDAIGE